VVSFAAQIITPNCFSLLRLKKRRLMGVYKAPQLREPEMTALRGIMIENGQDFDACLQD